MQRPGFPLKIQAGPRVEREGADLTQRDWETRSRGSQSLLPGAHICASCVRRAHNGPSPAAPPNATAP